MRKDFSISDEVQKSRCKFQAGTSLRDRFTTPNYENFELFSLNWRTVSLHIASAVYLEKQLKYEYFPVCFNVIPLRERHLKSWDRKIFEPII